MFFEIVKYCLISLSRILCNEKMCPAFIQSEDVIGRCERNTIKLGCLKFNSIVACGGVKPKVPSEMHMNATLK